MIVGYVDTVATVPIVASIFSSLWNFITGATGYIEEISSNWWFLAIVFVIAMLDSVIPVVPSETAVIAGGVAAGQGHYFVGFVIVVGAAGAFVGDNIAYLIGDKLSEFIDRRAAKRPKLATRIEWAKKQIYRRGGSLLITARFIPGGRTALTVSCGLTRQPRRWFMGWIAVASVIWATYAAGLGYFFGNRFENNHTAAFLVAFGTALSVTVFIEVIRHYWTSDDAEHDTPDPATSGASPRPPT